ncbi:hypothetical protein BJY04DRAFT_85637 [Aspergillus karnatakaensis]|uniref:putative trimethyllysine dioxygenase TmlH n=1 Tax=Aspergillus karnatakaensis TaxID=1810916 RepID=UPI003CCD971C
MRRTSLPRALSYLNHTGRPRQHGLSVFNRSMLGAVRLLKQDVPMFRVSSNQASLFHTMRRYSSLSETLEQETRAPEIPEQDVAPLEQPLSAVDSVASLMAGEVTLPVNSRRKKHAQFGNLWLRDSCPCDQCIHPDTKQRIVDTFSIPFDISPTNISPNAGGVSITWSDGHSSQYEDSWLYIHSRKQAIPASLKHLYRVRHNRRQYIPEKVARPTVSYKDVMADDAGVLSWLQKIYYWGFCFVNETPVDPESTEALLKRIAFVRHTHYGGFWDFTADMTFKDTAYTTEFLGAHTDNTYFTDPARLQLFHLLSHSDGEGGKSLLVDGFEAAKILAKENPDHARTLASIKHPYHASGNPDFYMTPINEYPSLVIHPSFRNSLYQVRWNNYDRATKWHWQTEEQELWYRAAAHFNEIIRRPQLEYWTQLEPGTALIFDNWRMLHGRSEFTGKRRMCGGYSKPLVH